NAELIKPVTEQEVLAAIQKSKVNKSPGGDGYTNEFYKYFNQLLGPILCRLFNWIIAKAVWPPTWNDSIISILPKEGRDLTKCSSYRPLSLINVDQKYLHLLWLTD
uniref:Reverse transcriptase n=1 Tax=Neogobius melanostomus TaxID=47308 RepID=A0A8C6SP21_9GOBI